MKCIAWLTGIHLNFLSPQKVKAFCRSIVEYDPETVLIGGDIADTNTIRVYLRILEDELCRPIYFVLGNHDYYYGSIAGVQAVIKELCDRSDWLHWLPAVVVVELTVNTGLIGIDSWADGRLGDYRDSMVLLNDYRLIKELTGLDQDARRVKLNELGDNAASDFKGVLPKSLDRLIHSGGVVAIARWQGHTAATGKALLVPGRNQWSKVGSITVNSGKWTERREGGGWVRISNEPG